MHSNIYWIVGLLFLLLVGIGTGILVYLSLSNAIYLIFNLLIFLLLTITFFLFALKKRVAFNLTRVVAIFQVIMGILTILLSLFGFAFETFMFGLFLILAGAIIFICTQKSKKIFEN